MITISIAAPCRSEIVSHKSTKKVETLPVPITHGLMQRSNLMIDNLWKHCIEQNSMKNTSLWSIVKALWMCTNTLEYLGRTFFLQISLFFDCGVRSWNPVVPYCINPDKQIANIVIIQIIEGIDKALSPSTVNNNV